MNKKFTSFQELSLITISSLLLILVYNFKTIESRFSLYSPEETLIFLSEIIIAFLTTFLFFFILSWNKKLLKSALITIFILSTISLYILNKFGIIFDEIMLANAFTSVGHISEVIDYSLAVYLLLGAALPAFFIIKIN